MPRDWQQQAGHLQLRASPCEAPLVTHPLDGRGSINQQGLSFLSPGDAFALPLGPPEQTSLAPTSVGRGPLGAKGGGVWTPGFHSQGAAEVAWLWLPSCPGAQSSWANTECFSVGPGLPPSRTSGGPASQQPAVEWGVGSALPDPCSPGEAPAEREGRGRLQQPPPSSQLARPHRLQPLRLQERLRPEWASGAAWCCWPAGW